MLESCVKLGGTLLQQWTPDGDKRDSSRGEKEFKKDLEDYFETAKCTRFDKDIQVGVLLFCPKENKITSDYRGY